MAADEDAGAGVEPLERGGRQPRIPSKDPLPLPKRLVVSVLSRRLVALPAPRKLVAAVLSGDFPPGYQSPRSATSVNGVRALNAALFRRVFQPSTRNLCWSIQ